MLSTPQKGQKIWTFPSILPKLAARSIKVFQNKIINQLPMG
jgi:hypothetical protein